MGCFKIYFHVMYMNVSLECKYVHFVCDWYLQGLVKGAGSPGTRSQVVLSCHMGTES